MINLEAELKVCEAVITFEPQALLRLRNKYAFESHFSPTHIFSILDAYKELTRQNQIMLEVLNKIKEHRSFVESQSTGMRQYFKTDSSIEAELALAQIKPEGVSE
jgi:hypothetical protein